jgi:hypothetical protein
MSTDREATRIVRSWLEDGVTQLPDTILDSVLDQLPTTSQRRVTWWPARRLSYMNTSMKIGLAAVAVVAATLLGYTYFVSPNVGDPSRTTPTASPNVLPRSGDLDPGRYEVEGASVPVRISFDLGDGWGVCSENPLEQGVCRVGPSQTPRSVVGVAFPVVENVVADPCATTLLDPPVGPSVDELVAALADLDGFSATAPEDVTVGGFPAKRLTVTAPANVDDTCELGTWATRQRTNGVGAGESNDLYVVDVDGDRIVIAMAYFTTNAGQEDLDEAQHLIDSIRIEP